MPDILQTPDYDLADEVEARTPDELRALADPTRGTILNLLMERAATTTELAEALGKAKSTIDHHLKALQRVGFVTVVRTRRVRAMTERFWGRTARFIKLCPVDTADAPAVETPDPEHHTFFLAEALRELRSTSAARLETEPAFASLRSARLDADRANEFVQRLHALMLEFMSSPRSGSTMFSMLLALYPTDQPTLKDPE